MPFNEVPAKWKAGTLHSGGPAGPVVKSQKQMVAIMLSEKRKSATNPEYAPTDNIMAAMKRKRMGMK